MSRFSEEMLENSSHSDAPEYGDSYSQIREANSVDLSSDNGNTEKTRGLTSISESEQDHDEHDVFFFKKRENELFHGKQHLLTIFKSIYLQFLR